MTMTEWDQDIAPRLQRVEQYSCWLTNDADTVRRNVKQLRQTPAFETKAGDSLHVAKVRLEAALKEINEAIADYAAKPVIDQRAA